jgi:nucleotide-binding universal stress UspA family protein
MFQTVVVGADGSPTASQAVDTAIELVGRSGGILHVVSAYKPLSRSNSGVPSEFANAVQPDSKVKGVLDDLAARARVRGITVEVHDQRGDPAQAVHDVAERVSADLIVTGSKGMKRRVLSSIPNSIAHQATCAVLIVKTD